MIQVNDEDDKSSLHSPYGTPPRTPRGLDLDVKSRAKEYDANLLENSNISASIR